MLYAVFRVDLIATFATESASTCPLTWTCPLPLMVLFGNGLSRHPDNSETMHQLLREMKVHFRSGRRRFLLQHTLHGTRNADASRHTPRLWIPGRFTACRIPCFVLCTEPHSAGRFIQCFVFWQGVRSIPCASECFTACFKFCFSSRFASGRQDSIPKMLQTAPSIPDAVCASHPVSAPCSAERSGRLFAVCFRVCFKCRPEPRRRPKMAPDGAPACGRDVQIRRIYSPSAFPKTTPAIRPSVRLAARSI